jgi:hypothetical protein
VKLTCGEITELDVCASTSAQGAQVVCCGCGGGNLGGAAAELDCDNTVRENTDHISVSACNHYTIVCGCDELCDLTNFCAKDAVNEACPHDAGGSAFVPEQCSVICAHFFTAWWLHCRDHLESLSHTPKYGLGSGSHPTLPLRVHKSL